MDTCCILYRRDISARMPSALYHDAHTLYVVHLCRLA